ncbi:MAG: SDR family NAD(P)-dependent oxidoreductase [Moorea sp. SIO1G6]|uniref:SDR family NAD(P)-dependent oxidoreductase n=1 Tax=Moorena sp. SIO1G6 TaxID=2607840 RepID=UPI0013C0F567|nr:SDR family NAD(P)-dependent oxidoreductase [Moorena sp. SIO1G6]NET65733.1 SDR family NAD(P)-dependent oxidoreductase [Moorena sp. SIO1G6]
MTQIVGVNIAIGFAAPKAIARAWRSYGPIDLLVNCAGVAHQAPFLESKLQNLEEEIATNLMGMYTMTRLIGRRMAARREGTIVNVSSLMGKVAAPTMASYSATKFGIVGFTQALRGELAPQNIRVIALLPSLTDTDMARGLQLFRWVLPMTPQQVAKVLVAKLEKNSSEILVGWQSHLAVWCQRFFPSLLEKVLRIAAPLSRNKSFGEINNKQQVTGNKKRFWRIVWDFGFFRSSRQTKV